mgnify:CR=1 FL=1
MLEYTPILVFIVFSVVLSVIIPAASYVLGIKKLDHEKASVFECGFDPFGDSRQKFEIRFFLVAMLLWLYGEKINKFIQTWMNVLFILFIIILIGGFGMVKLL